uniref:SCP domain-containing protein n=1 Tax=Strongyloides stercoralis TaxID=6248 RepID=A0A0K0EL45_STRER
MKFLLLNIRLFIIIIIHLSDSQKLKTNILNKRHTWHGYQLKQNDLLIDPKKIIYYLIDNKIFFQVNGYVFEKHKDALKYYNLINSKSVYSRFLPTGGMKPHKIKSYNTRIKISEYDYSDVVKKNPFTKKIWDRVWNYCKYDCFAKNHFQLFKQGILNEVNEYRRIHGVKALKLTNGLCILAQKYSDQNALHKSELLYHISSYGYVDGIIHKDLGSLFLKTLFDQFYGCYNFNNNLYYYQFLRQTQVIWKKTESMGVGVTEKDNLLYIFILFYPHGNINGKYKKNVLRVSDKVVHMFNMFNKKV